MIKYLIFSSKLIFWIIIILMGRLFAQNYHPFPTQNVFWGENSFYFQSLTNDESCQYFQDFTTGDTLVGAHLYHKLWSSGYYYPLGYCNNPFYSPLIFSHYNGAFREDSLDRKVYYLPAGSSSDTLLYDFNLNINDILPESYINQDYPNNRVTKFDSILIDGTYHKRYGITAPGFGGIDSNYAYIIEGVGSSWGLLEGLHPQTEAPSGSELTCFSVNGNALYPNTGAPCIFAFMDEPPEQIMPILAPNPFSKSTIITFAKKYKNIVIEVYNTQGKLLMVNQYQDESQIEFNRGNLISGLYFMKFFIDEKSITMGKIIVVE